MPTLVCGARCVAPPAEHGPSSVRARPLTAYRPSVWTRYPVATMVARSGGHHAHHGLQACLPAVTLTVHRRTRGVQGLGEPWGADAMLSGVVRWPRPV